MSQILKEVENNSIVMNDPQMEYLRNIQSLDEPPAPKPSICYRISICFTIATLAFGLPLALIVAYMNDRFESSVRRDISLITERVYLLEDKLSIIVRALEFISTGITEVKHNQLSEIGVKTLVKNELDQYDADKTGLVDFALESAGGQIISTRDTIPYKDSSYDSLFGISICPPKNSARHLIQARCLPGECWGFKGSKGNVIIKLLGSVFISGISIEHVSQNITPTGENTSAPKTFSIYGLMSKDDVSGKFLLGSFSYQLDGSTLQYFAVQKYCTISFLFVELIIESNHGNELYTCVYRLRVHGSLDTNKR